MLEPTVTPRVRRAHRAPLGPLLVESRKQFVVHALDMLAAYLVLLAVLAHSREDALALLSRALRALVPSQLMRPTHHSTLLAALRALLAHVLANLALVVDVVKLVELRPAHVRAAVERSL